MKLSRERILHLSHLVLKQLETDDAVELFIESQEIRQQVVKVISDEMKMDEVIDAAARRKIESQKRTILEGSDEWDVLYRKYYEDEQNRHRKLMP